MATRGRDTADRHRARARRDRRAVQAARLHLSLVGDLRRGRLDLRLRPLRGAAEEQRQERVVALDAHRSATTSSRSTRRSSSTRGSGRRRATSAGFSDPMVDCKTCKLRFRADHLEDVAVRAEAVEAARRGPRLRADRGARVQPDVRDAGRAGRRTRARWPTCARRPRRASSSTSRTSSQFARKKPPFGIAQIGKSFRNEITTGNFIFRTREFEQMEMEFFCPPDDAEQLARALDGRARCAGTPSSGSSPRT